MYRLNVFVDEDRKVLIFRVIGAMPSAEFVQRLHAAYATIDRPWTWSRVMDFRRFEGVIDLTDVEEMAQRWKAMTADQNYHARVAVVSTDPLDKARVPTASPLFPNETVCHFSDYHDAMAWVLADDDATRSA
ncbi:hypothetical protein ABAC460_09430 [Asticcacaulis sp. AC460]|uniref:hypothetical protein n=1 Tax=Asticcacaulis sp. AC460 TaxID=1282360 RepID=UPI0003C3EF79|nr:hypothetical protein [Asticcacaulis sp. AC460]ESQ90366.1 hypothetical protein ABAC460_09430 [Asticcacaulis sp. AC460]